MSSKSQFPWEALKAECLRTVCTQLMQSTGATYSEVRRKEDMISFLSDVGKRGLDKATQTLLETLKNEVKVQRPVRSPAKRKAETTDDQEYMEDEETADGYNTRYKGVKRVKVHATRTPRKKQVESAEVSSEAATTESAESVSVSAAPPVKRGRGRPRKSVASVNDTATAKTGGSLSVVGNTEGPSTLKRGRGRPRKSEPKIEPKSEPTSAKRPRGRPRKNPLPAATSAAPTSKGKEVFDGVVMERRAAPVTGDGPAESAAEDDEEGEDDAAEDEDDVDPVLRNGHLDDGASSLAGSNKENEPMFSNYTPDRDIEDTDAQGEPDRNSQGAATAETVQTVDMTQSAVIMRTIPMVLAAAASNSSAPPPDSVQPSVANSASQDRPALQPL